MRKRILIGLPACLGLVLLLVGIFLNRQREPSIRRAREAVLRQDLYDLRKLLDEYTLDKQRHPDSLDDLVKSGCLKSMPFDPMTRRNDTWIVERSNDLGAPGIVDLHSGSRAMSSAGTSYADW